MNKAPPTPTMYKYRPTYSPGKNHTTLTHAYANQVCTHTALQCMWASGFNFTYKENVKISASFVSIAFFSLGLIYVLLFVFFHFDLLSTILVWFLSGLLLMSISKWLLKIIFPLSPFCFRHGLNTKWKPNSFLDVFVLWAFFSLLSAFRLSSGQYANTLMVFTQYFSIPAHPQFSFTPTILLLENRIYCIYLYIVKEI